MFTAYLSSEDLANYVISPVIRFTEKLHPDTTLDNGASEGHIVKRLDIVVSKDDTNAYLIENMVPYMNNGDFTIVIKKNENEEVFAGENYTEFSHISLVGQGEDLVYTLSWSKQVL